MCVYIYNTISQSINFYLGGTTAWYVWPRQAAKDVQTAWDLEPSEKIGPGRKQSRFLARDLPKSY